MRVPGIRGGHEAETKAIADYRNLLWVESKKGLWKTRDRMKVFSSHQATKSKGSMNASTKDCSLILIPSSFSSYKLSLLKIRICVFNNHDRGRTGRSTVEQSPAIHSSSDCILITAAEMAFPLTLTRSIISQTELKWDDFTHGQASEWGTAHLWLHAGA